MTPAIRFLKKNKIVYKVHEYAHEQSNTSYGLEASEKLGVDSARVFKTLVIASDHNILAVGVIPVSSKLSMKNMAKALGYKKASMALKEDAERSTGYVLGGVSPLGQKKPLKTVIDNSAFNSETIFISGGKRGLDLELSPSDLQNVLKAQFSAIAI